MFPYNVKNATPQDIAEAIEGFDPAPTSPYRLLYYAEPRDFPEAGNYYGRIISGAREEAQARANKVYQIGVDLIANQTDGELIAERNDYLDYNRDNISIRTVAGGAIPLIERGAVVGLDQVLLSEFLTDNFIGSALVGDMGGMMAKAGGLLSVLTPGTDLDNAKILAVQYIFNECVLYKRKFPDLNGAIYGNVY